MKQLFAGIVLIVLIGVGGFFYRNVTEKPGSQASQPACTLEVKVCPDGTSVGREGPSCSFAPCLPPNLEVTEAGVSFVLPAGYTQVMRGAAHQENLRIFEKASMSENAPHLITLKRFVLPEGKTADDVMLENTRLQPADLPIESMDEFDIVAANGKTFYKFTIERFEGQVHTAYYLPRANDVLRFDILERDVSSWTDPSLVIDTLPEHRNLQTLIESVQTN